MTRTTLHLRDDHLHFRAEHAGLDEPRPFFDADAATLRSLAERYAAALATPARSAPGLFAAVGRDLHTWLDGGESWLARAAESIRPPWLFEIALPLTGPLSPGEAALLEAPWELLRDAHGFLASRPRLLLCPIRRLGQERSPRPPSEEQLSVVFMAASPEHTAALDFEAEEAAILDATRRVEIDLLVEESGSLERLAERMAEETPVDVLHISCHGVAKPSPHLKLEDERGRLHKVSPDRLAHGLGSGLPSRLLFLSACETADPYGVLDTFAVQMIHRGVPAALGWGGSVRDDEARRFASALYRHLALKESLESSVARARFDLLDPVEGGAEPAAFHMARLYLGPEGGGVMSLGKKRKIRADVDQAFLNAKDKQVPVATQVEFVGRRRPLQAVLRFMADPEGKAGVLVHGMGHHGKSSLAARVAQRMRRHLPVVVYGSYGAGAILQALDHQTSKGPIHRVVSEARQAVERDAGELRLALRELLEGPCRDDYPLLLVIDDVEQLLEGSKEALHKVKGAYVDVLRSLLMAFEGADTASRLLLTSRYDFSLPLAGRDLAASLAKVHLPPMMEVEGRKQARAKEKALKVEGKLDRDMELRCVRAARGNPGLQNLLFKSALEAPDVCARAVKALECHLADGKPPGSEDVRAFLEKLVLDELLRLLSEEERALLRRSSVFKLAVPLSVLGKGERLLALGLWDRYADPGGSDESAALINPLVRPLVGELREGEAEEAARAWVRGLFEAWGGAGAKRPRELDVELGRVALLGKDGYVVARVGGWLVRDFYNRNAYREGREAGLAALTLAEEQGKTPSLVLLKATGEACVQVGEVAEAAAIFGRALIQVDAAEKRREKVDSFDHASLLLAHGRLIAQQGNLDRAMASFEQARDLLGSVGAEFDRALAISGIADILQARGQLDEALRIRKEEELPVYDKLGDIRERAATMGKIADILHARGQLDEALRIRKEESLPVYDKLGDIRERAVTMGKIADILQVRGQLDEALRIRREEELPVYDKLGDVRSRAVAMGKIADILQVRGQLDEALRIRREEELPVYDKLGDIRSRAVTMGYIADILQARGRLDEALRIRQEEELPVYDKLGDIRSRAVTMGKIADILQARGRLDEALRILQKDVLPVFEKLGDISSRLVARTNIALLLLRRNAGGDRDEASTLLALALQDAVAMKLPEAEQIHRLQQKYGV